jgi:putative phage-type endonuclease
MNSFIEDRRSGIGGSDAAAVIGISPWSTPLAIYERKLGLVPDVEETAAMRWGTILEAPIADEYARVTGRQALVAPMQRHPQHPWMIAHVDRVVDTDRIVEIKTSARGEAWGEPGSDDLPAHYLTQCQHYLSVTGARVCDVAVLLNGSDFRIYPVERDEALIAYLIEREGKFWREHVLAKNPPEAVTLEDAKRRWTAIKGKTYAACEKAMALLRVIRSLRQSQKADGAQEREAMFALLTLVSDSETIVDPDSGQALATLKTSQRKAHSVQASVCRSLLFKKTFDESATTDLTESA